MKLLTTLALVLFLCWPVSAMAGCAGEGHPYYVNTKDGTIWIYAGITFTVADANTVKMDIFNFLPYFSTRNFGEQVSIADRAAECNITPDEIKIYIPPDCNLVPIGSVFDVDTSFFYRLAIDYRNLPVGIYTGQVRLMTSRETSERDVVIVRDEKYVIFWLEDCKK